jgi:hypothetical protein
MRARLWPAVAVSFGALLFLSTLFAWLVSREAAGIHEHTKIARQIYQRADDAISDIQANINKGALIEQSGFSNLNVVESQRRISDLQRNTGNDLTCSVRTKSRKSLPYSKAWISTGAPFNKVLAHRERSMGNRDSSASWRTNRKESSISPIASMRSIKQAWPARSRRLKASRLNCDNSRSRPR